MNNFSLLETGTWITRSMYFLSGFQLYKRTGGDETCDKARIYCVIAEVYLILTYEALFIYFNTVNDNCTSLSNRKSSGFSRGASIYRGVTRFGIEVLQYIILIVWYCCCLCFSYIPSSSCKLYLRLLVLIGTINRVDGKQELAVLRVTKICTLEHLVSQQIQ